MADPRVKRLADILVNYSIKIKKGDLIDLHFEVDAKELALECYKLILKKGAYPVVNASVPGFAYTYYKNASGEYLKMFNHKEFQTYEEALEDGLLFAIKQFHLYTKSE